MRKKHVVVSVEKVDSVKCCTYWLYETQVTVTHRTCYSTEPNQDRKVQTSTAVQRRTRAEGHSCPSAPARSSSGDSAAATACEENASQCLSVRSSVSQSVRAPMRNRNNLSNTTAVRRVGSLGRQPGRPTLRPALYVILPHRPAASSRDQAEQ